MNEKQDYERGCTITLSGSGLSWDDIDAQAKTLGLKRSGFIHHTIKFYMKDKQRRKTRDSIMFGLIILIFLAILLQIIGIF